MNRFILILVGDAEFIHRQAVFAILSVLAHVEDDEHVAFHIITDHPEWYSWIAGRVHIEHVSDSTLREWRGPYDYFWRLKLSAMRHIHESCAGGNLIYMDSDVVVRQDLRPFLQGLREGVPFMHKKEYGFESGKRTLLGLRHQSRGRTPGAIGGLPITQDSAMWNAGVVAIPDGDCNRFLGDAVRCCDELCRTRAMRKSMEQVSLSLSLDQKSALQPASPWFVHFWGNKPPWNALISTFLAESLLKNESIPQACERLRTLDLDMPCSIPRTKGERMVNSIRKRFGKRDHLVENLVHRHLVK